MNDRALRDITVGMGGPGNGYIRQDGFDISVTSEIMAILCLASDAEDVRRRIAAIVVGFTRERTPVTARDIGADGAMAALLKEAINPNLCQTLEHSPAIIHGGPFANIAHGCSSICGTMLGLTLGDYCITEAGFGADLGMEKFLDIKCRASSDAATCERLSKGPDLVVLVVSLRAVKLHGGHDEPGENLEALKVGMKNVQRHCENIHKFGLNSIVCINKFPMDTAAEVELATAMCKDFPSVFQVHMANHWAEGGSHK